MGDMEVSHEQEGQGPRLCFVGDGPLNAEQPGATVRAAAGLLRRTTLAPTFLGALFGAPVGKLAKPTDLGSGVSGFDSRRGHVFIIVTRLLWEAKGVPEPAFVLTGMWWRARLL